jgi:CheY-like chemotaxis protein
MNAINILLVEDNEGDILLTKEALDETDIEFDLCVVTDGEQAFEFLSRTNDFINASPPDLILLDINLPKRNGHEVLSFVKGSEHLKHIPVIMLTTSSYEKDVNRAYQNHANCFITKSVEMDAFMEAIAKIVNFWATVVKLSTINKV